MRRLAGLAQLAVICLWMGPAVRGQCANPVQIPNQTISSGSYTFSDQNALKADELTVNGSASVSAIAGNCINLGAGLRAGAGTAVPASGSGLSLTFTWTASSPAGSESVAEMYGLFNTMITGVNGCYLRYNRASHLLFLADNGASYWMGGIAPGSAQTVENSQCKIYGSGASVSGAGTQLAVAVPVEFKAGFSGTKNSYMFVRDSIGQSSPWQQMGTWTAPGGQQYVLTTSANPAGGGTVTPPCPGGCLYNSGAVVAVTAAPNAGYQFSGFGGALISRPSRRLISSLPSVLRSPCLQGNSSPASPSPFLR